MGGDVPGGAGVCNGVHPRAGRAGGTARAFDRGGGGRPGDRAARTGGESGNRRTRPGFTRVTERTTIMKSLPKLPSLPKAKSLVRCACGCNGLTQNRFVPGHDSKLKGMRIRVERSLWDRSDDAIGNPEAQLDALAEMMGDDDFAYATAQELGVDWTPKAEREEAAKAEAAKTA